MTASGELVELEIEVRGTDVPEPVRAAAVRTLVGATAIKFVRLKSGLYEAESTIGGREREVMLTASGEPARNDDDDDDDDDD